MAKVGNRQPPEHSRFRKGQSGNPKGRPKGSRNLSTELKSELRERISITEGGVSRLVSKQRGLVKTLYARSVKGDMRAMSQILKLIATCLEDDEPVATAETVSAEDQEVLRLYEQRLQRRLSNNKDQDPND
jgi:Family of unknown function (DUF5681)